MNEEHAEAKLFIFKMLFFPHKVVAKKKCVWWRFGVLHKCLLAESRKMLKFKRREREKT